MNKFNIIEGIIKDISNDELMPRFNKVQAQNKKDGSLVTQADWSVQEAVKIELAKQFPEFGFFAEEMTDSELKSFFAENHSGYWCLDPLDGTSNFASGLPYFAISLALIKDNQTVFGLVYDPVRDECFTAIKGEGVWLNGQAVVNSQVPQTLAQCIAIVDLKRLPAELAVKLATHPPYRSQRSFGAAALEWCWLATGRCQLFLHGKQMLWDYAAGLLIAQEAGCAACDFDGGPIFQPSLKSKKVIASLSKDLHKQWYNFIT